MSARDIARAYLARGWAPIPVPYKSKGPVLKGWPNFRVTEDTVDRCFAATEQNIGILLGEPSEMLIDIDLDSPEALEFADSVLVPSATFGRISKRRSHRLYVSQISDSYRFADPIAKETGNNELLLEIRSTGLQTLFPDSVHPGGEHIRWDDEGEPVRIESAELLRRARFLAAISLAKRYWPAKGGRHAAALALTGLFARAGVPRESIAQFVTAINDGESMDKHLSLASGAIARVADGRPVPGVPKVRVIYGDKVTSLLLEWLGLIPPKPSPTQIAAAIEDLSRASTREEVSAAIGLLRSAELEELANEDFLQDIAARTGKPITSLRKQLGRRHRRHRDETPTQAKELVEIGKQAYLFYDSESGNAFARIERDGHHENHRIGSTSFTEWISLALYEKTDMVPDRTTISNALSTLSGLAKIEGEAHRTWLRVAWDGEAIYVDLGDPTWKAVRISGDGWEIISDPPVRFYRAGGHALPEPERSGSIQDLRPFVNADEQGFMLIVAFAVNAFRPDKPFPILLITGEKGSAKSTLLGLLRLLLDPAPAPGAGLATTEGNLMVTAKNNWLVTGDNLSFVGPEMADALCRLSSGGGLRKRMLYTDGDEYAIDAKRPIALTSLCAVTNREDFLDRVLMVTLDRIEGNRKTEEQVLDEFEAVRGRILGALFDGVSTGLRLLASTDIEELPRLADFYKFAIAAGNEYGWDPEEFAAAFAAMRATVFEESAMSDPVIGFIADFMAELPLSHPGFDCSPSELLEHLTAHIGEATQHLLRHKQWPKSAASLSKKLRSARTGLAQLGVEATVTRSNNNKSRVILTYSGERKTKHQRINQEPPVPF